MNFVLARHVVTRIQSSAARQSEKFKANGKRHVPFLLNEIFQPKFRNFFINNKQPWFKVKSPEVMSHEMLRVTSHEILSSSKIACVASVSSRVRRESWDESKNKERTGEGEGNEGSPSNFRAVTRLETLTTQASSKIS